MAATRPTPDTLDAVATAAAIVHIQQLAIRYAQGVDQRDLASVAELFVPDVDCGHWGRGRDALERMYRENDATMGVSIHRVSTHSVEVVDGDSATGTVYLTAEHQQHDGSWARIAGAYHDRYARIDDRWFFAQRRLLCWYRDSDTLAPTTSRDTDYRVFAKWETLPTAWPSWNAFWDEAGDRDTSHPSVDRGPGAGS